MNFNHIDYVLCQKHKFYAYIHAQRVITNLNEVLFFLAGLSKMVEIRLRDGQKVTVRDRMEFDKFLGSPNFREQFLKNAGVDISNTNNSQITLRFPDNLKLRFYYNTKKEQANILYTTYDLFVLNTYALPSIKGKEVLDIGANIGDSAIYFATKGAKKVIAFEPFPATYRQAKENIYLNGMEKKIELLNIGVGGKSETIFLPDTFIGTSGMDSIGKSALDENTDKGAPVRIVTLEEIIKMYPSSETVLKMDCEGCEYASLLNATDDTLKHFSEIILEYHEKSGKLMEKFRKAGFTPELKSGRIMLAKRNG